MFGDGATQGKPGEAPIETSPEIAIYLARELSGQSGQALGTAFGQISGAAISSRCKYIAEALTANRKLERDV